jgi:hypothetical protein
VVAQPALELLTDRFALPHWLPLANVFSVGDILIGAGVFALIVATMLDGRRKVRPSGPAGPRIDPYPAPGAGTH